MEETQWGVGKNAKEKAFDVVNTKYGSMELIFGEHPHSRSDNTIYARDKEGRITGFDGHRRPFKIEIEEYNYMKESEMSGDQIRKGCSVKVYCDGVQVFDDFRRNYEAGYRVAHQFILDMELNWGWFPKEVDKEIGRVVGYREQLFKIESFIVSQAAMMLVTLDGKPRKRFLWEEEDDFDPHDGLKVEITSEHLDWYPKHEKEEA